MYKDAYLSGWATCGVTKNFPSRVWHARDKQLSFKRLITRTTFVRPSEPRIRSFLKAQKIHLFFPSSRGSLCPKLPRFCVGPCCQDIIGWSCSVIFDMGGITWLKWCTVVHFWAAFCNVVKTRPTIRRISRGFIVSHTRVPVVFNQPRLYKKK